MMFSVFRMLRTSKAFTANYKAMARVPTGIHVKF